MLLTFIICFNLKYTHGFAWVGSAGPEGAKSVPRCLGPEAIWPLGANGVVVVIAVIIAVVVIAVIIAVVLCLCIYVQIIRLCLYEDAFISVCTQGCFRSK